MDERLEHLLLLLNRKCGLEAENHTVTDAQVRISSRVPKEGMANWLSIMDYIIDAAAVSPNWNEDLSKQYFKRNSRMIFCWRLIFQGPNILDHLPEVSHAVQSAPLARRIIEEQPLAGASPHRNALRKGKGAQNPLKARVGPASWGNR